MHTHTNAKKIELGIDNVVERNLHGIQKNTFIYRLWTKFKYKHSHKLRYTGSCKVDDRANKPWYAYSS